VSWLKKAGSYLHKLSVDIDSRRVGSPGNRQATDFFARTVASFGWAAESTAFDCVDWSQEGVDLAVGGELFQAFASPYSLGCRVFAPLAVVATLQELETVQATGHVLLLRGELAKEQLMPKNFPFYNPDQHRQIIALLEGKKPAAIVAATSRDVQMVGSMYPFPLIEDGDFDIPSVYITEEEGQRLAGHAGQEVWLESRARRIPARGYNVVARRGHPSGGRIVVFAHIDSRIGTPGANDNASGVVSLLLLAELLADYAGGLSLELVAMNGEDYFCSPGEQLWLAQNKGRLDDILLGINLDDVGYHKGKVAYSLYDCPPELAAAVRQALASYPGLVEGEPWYQGDHGLFLIYYRPALAFTSELVGELMAEITHTPKDRAEIVDPGRLVTVARGVRDAVKVVAS